MYSNTAQEFIEPRANAHAIPRLTGLHLAFSIMGQFIYYTNLRLLSHKNVTFTAGNEKSSKHSFPIKIPFSCQYFLLLTNFLISGCKVY